MFQKFQNYTQNVSFKGNLKILYAFIVPFTHSFNNCILCIFLGTEHFISTESTAFNKTDKMPTFLDPVFQSEERELVL